MHIAGYCYHLFQPFSYEMIVVAVVVEKEPFVRDYSSGLIVSQHIHNIVFVLLCFLFFSNKFS